MRQNHLKEAKALGISVSRSTEAGITEAMKVLKQKKWLQDNARGPEWLRAVIFCFGCLLLPGQAVALEPGEVEWHSFELGVSLNNWRTSGDNHGGYQASLAFRPAERHRWQARYTDVSNDVSNGWSAFKDIITLCDLRSDCDSSDNEGRTIREHAVLYQYRVWGKGDSQGAAEFWLGGGPGWIKETQRQQNPALKQVRRDTGVAWSTQLVGRGSRFYTALTLEGNTEINGTLVGLGFGFGF
ncbi:type II toxin-antitoxin system CcdA family antitoxin [Marinobacter shengliensis]|uniref:type II toxin-antitoxin system CcdA family antitoxin n=1 Tax=Marinobacter shengliensis TaxID=1389223 RepID=UPI0022A96EC0|nr:type II toxin-antitoxin system CcdA family antitoxin [Marinobacter shengliensis]MCD1631157.1 type II toxin-antitoxin system CcdA family antitoxin [Marinobacter shengliensis]